MGDGTILDRLADRYGLNPDRIDLRTLHHTYAYGTLLSIGGVQFRATHTRLEVRVAVCDHCIETDDAISRFVAAPHTIGGLLELAGQCGGCGVALARRRENLSVALQQASRPTPVAVAS